MGEGGGSPEEEQRAHAGEREPGRCPLDLGQKILIWFGKTEFGDCPLDSQELANFFLFHPRFTGLM